MLHSLHGSFCHSITNVAFSHVALLQFVFTVSALLSVKTYFNAKLGC
jgi:hypothetical protein